MKHNNFFFFFPVFLVSLTTLITTQLPRCLADTTEFTNCSKTLQCGTVRDIGYPFWGLNRADYCGAGPDYRLTCLSDTILQITVSGLTYRVLRYDNASSTLSVAISDYYDNLCPVSLRNVTSIAPFRFSSDTVPSNLTIYYNCSSLTVIQSTAYQFTCSLNGTSGVTNYFVPSDLVGAVAACGSSVVFPVNGTTLEALEGDLTEADVAAVVNGGFGLRWTDESGVCERCVSSGGQCGTGRNTSSADGFVCYCSNKVHPLTCASVSSGSGSISKLPIIVTAVLIPLVLAAIACMFLVIRRHNILRRFSPTTSQTGEDSFDVQNFFNGIAPRKYHYSDLKRMTNSFSEKLGQGGYGSVYKGRLKDGRLVAVKILSGSKGSSGEDFFNEVVSISRTAHVNVVALLGYCYERKRRALVYEYMPNGSLDKFIITKGAKDRGSALECKVLYQIALGVARGLEYLHRGCNTRIVHFDIKPHNILLDQDFVPKISDFGLAKLWQGKESMVSMQGTRGTIGYIAPEVFCRNFGGVSHKSDVYSYGMLVLDMVCGRYNSNARVSHTSDAYFPDWIYKEYLHLRKDTTINGITTEEEEVVTRKMIIVSLWCIQNLPSDRPSIKEVIEMLEGSIEALQVPLLKPFQASPERLPQLYSATQSSSLTGEEEMSILEPEIRAVDSRGAGKNILTHLN